MSARTIYFDLLKQLKTDSIIYKTSFRNFFWSSGFLIAKLIAWKSENNQPFFAVLSMQVLQSAILRSKPAFDCFNRKIYRICCCTRTPTRPAAITGCNAVPEISGGWVKCAKGGAVTSPGGVLKQDFIVEQNGIFIILFMM